MEKNKKIESTGPNMKRFFFNVTEAVDLILKSLNNISKFQGKILTKKMKCAKISEILEVWCKYYYVNWKEIAPRLGDLENEILIGELERENTREIKLSDEIFYIIDPNKKVKDPIKSQISTKNSQRLNKKEILDLILKK